MQRILVSVVGAALLLAAWGGPARAEPPHPGEEDPECRAGNPHCVACWAIPSENKCSVGYYVGGGCPIPCLAEPRCVNEGTWGWDYSGWLFRRHVILGWWHGRCYQDGTGAYKSDGPKLPHHESE